MFRRLILSVVFQRPLVVPPDQNRISRSRYLIRRSESLLPAGGIRVDANHHSVCQSPEIYQRTKNSAGCFTSPYSVMAKVFFFFFPLRRAIIFCMTNRILNKLMFTSFPISGWHTSTGLSEKKSPISRDRALSYRTYQLCSNKIRL